MTEQPPASSRHRPAPPAVTRVTGDRASRAASGFAPPFAAGRTLPRRGSSAAAAADTEAGEPADVATEAAPAPEWEAHQETDEEGAAVPAWDTHETLPQDQPAEFPLDAFFIPEHARSLPAGVVAEGDAIAGQIAERLDELSRRVREGGLLALGDSAEPDELTRLIAGVIAGYVTGRG